MADIFEQVKGVIVEKLGTEPDKVTMDASFVDDLGADSLETVELIMGLEDKFGITIQDEDAEKIRTVKDAVDFIQAHAAQA
ncbi:MAG TPA: acyl carrier protein [Deinococcales bacterium]|nr:acyl carrier protein [Deinococcales bacterium]